MKYYIDFLAIRIEDYKGFLTRSNLIPSQMMLKDHIDNRFLYLKENGIYNLDDLEKALKTKKKIEAFAKTTGIPEDYLIILNRAVTSLHPPARNISDYPGISRETVDILEGLGMKDSMHLFENMSAEKNKAALLKNAQLDDKEIERLYKISCLCRLRYVNPVFANVLIAAGCETVEQTAGADAVALYEKIKIVNVDNQFFKGKIGLNDIKFLINDANYFKDKLD